MAVHRTRESKAHPNYNFLISWSPTRRVSDPEGNRFQARVKREQDQVKVDGIATLRHGKSAESLAQGAISTGTKKSIVRSLILVGFILILELVVYLAWSKFVLS